ncbi:hypothetical protein DV738_g145, partial [Chaetothyriales sp. CBS 135597]
MADSSTPEDIAVTFHVKNARGDKYTFTLPLSTTALELKTKLAEPESANLPVSSQRLIYSGKVLKDGDTLAQHNVKEGNSMHLVKSAASNQRQNPAAQSTSTGSVSNSPAAGVPQNLASGTGNDPLAGLTGARYAGFTQLPSADLFQNPPTQEDIIRQLQDPNFAQMMREAMNNPTFIDMMINAHPQLRNMGPQARQILQSEQFRQMMTNPDSIRQMMQMQQMFGGGGGGGFGGLGGFGGGQADNGFPAPGATTTTDPQSLGENPAGNLNGTQPNWMDLFGSGVGAPADTRPPEERYATQLRQLNEMGFHDFDRNIQALSRSGGDIISSFDMATKSRSVSPVESLSEKTNKSLSTGGCADASAEVQAGDENAELSTTPCTTAVASDASTAETTPQPTTGIIAEMTGSQSGQLEVVINHVASASPSSPQPTGNKLPRPKHKDEKMLQSLIAKAHAQVREGTPVTSSIEEQEKAVVKYAEIVSQMTLLLAALGVGRNTTVRALAYLSGSDSPDVKTALRQAKQDRRDQNMKKRQASEASSTAHRSQGKSDGVNSKAPSSSVPSNISADDSVAVANHAPAQSSQKKVTEVSVLCSVELESQSRHTAKSKSTAGATDKSDDTITQKNRFARKWWGKARRRNGEMNQKPQANDMARKLIGDGTSVAS